MAVGRIQNEAELKRFIESVIAPPRPAAPVSPPGGGGGGASGPAGGVLSGTYPDPDFAVDMATQAELNAAIASAVNDGDAAGGVLSGTYPNPGFAVDMATQAELDAALANAVENGDAAGGDLSGTYPNPVVEKASVVNFEINPAGAASARAIIGNLNASHGVNATGIALGNDVLIYRETADTLRIADGTKFSAGVVVESTADNAVEVAGGILIDDVHGVAFSRGGADSVRIYSEATDVVSIASLAGGSNYRDLKARAIFADGAADGTSFIEFQEQSADPSAPAANNARLFLKDNGSGKTALMVRFPSGASQQLAVEL